MNMKKIKFNVGDKEIKISKSIVKSQFNWLSNLFGINNSFQEKEQLKYDILDYLPNTCDLEVISILSNINEWIYDKKKIEELKFKDSGLEAINFLKYGPSKIENIKKWQCTKCLKLTKYKKKKEKLQHELKFFGSNDCAAVCINCGIRWSSWYHPQEDVAIFCKKINESCKHNWEKI